MPENQNIEYKESWRDEYLKWICGFANAQGGKMFIGVDDKGNIKGLSDYKKLMDEIPNKAVSHLGLVIDINLHEQAGKHYIEIITEPSSVPISYHGSYHYRSGSTKQELKGTALHQFLLKKMGVSWEQKPIPGASLNDIDEEVVKSFLQKALARQRISGSATETDTLTILKNLELINEKGEFLLAALLLFGKTPKKYAPAAYFKIGRFGKSHSDLRFQDIIEGSLLEMADKVMEILDRLYLIRPISYNRLQRIEGLEYPEQALREAVLNAIIHKDYSDTTIFLRVYDDSLVIWNPGKLPESMTIEQLKGKHESKPRNRLIADVFFMAGYIEAWGRGINIIMEGCKNYGLPEPIIEEEQGGISITFLKDIYTEEYLTGLGLQEKYVRTLLFIKENGRITNTQFQKLLNVSKRTGTNDLQFLMDENYIEKTGTRGRGTYYTLKRR